MTSTEIAAVRPARTPRRSGPRSTLTRSSGLGLGIAMIWFSLLVLIPLAAVVVTAIDGGLGRLLDDHHQRPDRRRHQAHRLHRCRRHGGQRRDGHRSSPGSWSATASGASGARGADRHPLRAADDRRRPGAALALRHRQPDRHRHRQHSARRCSSRSSSSRCRSWSARSSRCSRSSTSTSRRPRPRSARAGSPPSAASSCPASSPAIAAGAALSFARGVSEYGSLVLLSGNLPFKTEVTSVRILSSIENDNVAGGRGRRDGAAGDLARGDRGARPDPEAGGRRG